MKKLIATLILAAANTLPALANDNYLLQYPGYSNATELRTNSPLAPRPGGDCEVGTAWALWIPVGGDQTIQHYVVNLNHSLTYAPPVIPTPVPRPDPLSAEKAIRADANISLSAKVELAKFKSVLDAYPEDPAGVQQMWAGIKIEDTAISADEATEVETICAQYNMPLK